MVVIESGAGGGVAASVYAEAERSVLVVEAGAWPETPSLTTSHLASPRSASGLPPFSGPDQVGNPRILQYQGDSVPLTPADSGWNNNAFIGGGGTRMCGAQAWRFCPDGFRMASRYGIPDGSALADWPITYDDLEPYYTRAEQEIGVDGVHNTMLPKAFATGHCSIVLATRAERLLADNVGRIIGVRLVARLSDGSV